MDEAFNAVARACRRQPNVKGAYVAESQSWRCGELVHQSGIP